MALLPDLTARSLHPRRKLIAHLLTRRRHYNESMQKTGIPPLNGGIPVSLESLTVRQDILCLQVCLQEPHPLVHIARYFCQQVCGVGVAGLSRDIDGCAHVLCDKRVTLD